MRRMGKWLKPRLYLKIIENTFLALSMALIPFYMQETPSIWIPGWILVVTAVVSGFLNLFLVKYN